MVLARDLVLTPLHNTVFQAFHVPCVDNTQADLISRFQINRIQERLPRCRPRTNSSNRDPSPDEVVAILRELLHSSPAEASRKLYSCAWVVFTEFYHCYQSVHVHLPVLAACIALFISFLCARGLAPPTINSYLSAQAYINKIQGHYDLRKSFLIEKLLVAVGQRSQADIRLPISCPLLYELVQALAHTSTSAYQRSLYGSTFMIAF